MSNYPLPTQIEVDECLRELREQREARGWTATHPPRPWPRRSPSLPTYFNCPDCDGNGYKRVPFHNPGCIGGAACPCTHTEVVKCESPRCFDGLLICFFCHEEGREPRVENPGVNFTVPVLATRMDGNEAVCDGHFPVFEEIDLEGAGTA